LAAATKTFFLSILLSVLASLLKAWEAGIYLNGIGTG